MGEPKHRTSAKWTDANDQIFIDLCVDERVKGNRNGGSLNKAGWKNVVAGFNSKTGNKLDQKQLKNRWDLMRREWTLYKHLMHGCTGIGWDPIRKMIEASDEWWEEQIKVNSNYRKFRNRDLTLIHFKYDNLFRDSVATGERARASTQRSGIGISLNDDLNLNEDPEYDNAEGSGDSDEIQGAHNARGRNNMFPPSSFQAGTSSGSKRKRSSTSSIKDGIQSLLNMALTKSTKTVSYAPPEGPTIEECMVLLDGLEGVPKYTTFYYFSHSLFEKSGNRKIFMAQTDDRARVGWLEFKYMNYNK